MTNYLGRQPQSGAYLKLDNIAGSFNGSTTTFNLTSGGVSVTPGTEQALEIVISGVKQEYGSAYNISSSNPSQIVFTGAPASTDTFFGQVLGETFDIGTPSSGTVSSSSLSSSFFVKNNQTLTGVSTSSSENALLVGPITVSGTVTITAGTTLVII
tara:strand:+ start:387 stop:854 length:468 start_codon:yes stop_codon:yes gene_type:complete